MQKQPNGGFPAIYQEVLPEDRLNMRVMKDLEPYDIKYLHFHTCIEIGICVSGSGICCIDGREFPFQAGDIHIIFPYMNHLHRNDSAQPSKWYWLFIDYGELSSCLGVRNAVNFEEDILPRIAAFGPIREAEFPRTVATLRRMYHEAIQDPAGEFAAAKLALNLYLSFIYLLEESAGRPPIPRPEHHKDIIKIAPALREIATRIDAKESITVAELAAICNYSETNFRRIFTRYFHCSPQQYISECRIRLAKKLLITGHSSIRDVADMVGFENISGFNRAFKALVGMSPSEYRAQSNY